VFRLHEGFIYAISYTVPRKVRKYHDDLYPDTRSLVPALTGSSWLSGSNGTPNRVTMDPSILFPEGRRKLDQKQEEQKIEIETKEKEQKEEVENAKVREEQKLIEETEKKIANQPKIVRSTFYRHIFGTPSQKKDCIQDVSPNRTNADGNLLKASTAYYAITISGAGGRMATIPTSYKGRLPITYCCIESGSVISDFDFSPFDPNQLCTGHEDGRVRVWNLPKQFDFKDANIKEASYELSGHRRKILTTSFSNSATGVLLSSSMDFDFKIWDIESKTDKISFNNAHQDIINNTDWSWDGSKFISSSRDTTIKIFDTRDKENIMETKGHSNAKTSKVAWLGDREKVLSAGFTSDSSRGKKKKKSRFF
jgi:WD40 repeat protein